MTWKYFLWFLDFLFTLLTGSFEAQKLVILIKPKYLFFSFLWFWCISVLVDLLIVQSNMENGVLTSLTIVVKLSFSPFNSVSFYSCILQPLVTYIFVIIMSSFWIDPFIFIKYSFSHYHFCLKVYFVCCWHCHSISFFSYCSHDVSFSILLLLPICVSESKLSLLDSM